MARSIKNKKDAKRERRHRRVRSKVSGTLERPRLAVFRSNRFLYVQLIDDVRGVTLAASSTKGVTGKSMLEKATGLGKTIAEAAQKKAIKTVVFDRGGYLYTGRIKAVAEGARAGGLTF